ncbi:MAG TPA: hypothetical protein PLA68_15000, partial [Panacibacter sp.]|nr:hypothetical protein [Panacibacter sp.]
MKQYRLHRNNRETGPHTAEELIHSGFKKYDLIWAEGKSAAWRYPGELDEFKQYAPIIEEQPYDRFYKKPAPVTSPKKEPAFLEINNIPAIATHKQKPRIKIKADCHKIETSQIKEPSLKKEFTTTFEPVQKAVPEWKDMWLNWEQEKQAVSNNTAKKIKINNTPALEIKYSQSLDDIKERYAETVLHSKNKSSFSRNNNYITAIILITAILGIGVWMGIKWSGSDGKNEPANAIHQQPVLSTAEPLKDGGINSEATFPVNKQSPENTGNDNQENIK